MRTKGTTTHTNVSLPILAALMGLTVVLLLPGFSASRASTASYSGQNVLTSGLDSARREALEKLCKQLIAGSPFSEEEAAILRKFNSGASITDLEADVVISRALYDFYVAAKELTKDQQLLLDRYQRSVPRRATDIANLKTQLLNKRIAAAAGATPHVPQAAPPNDLCAGAEIIPAAGPFPYFTAITADITDATTTGDPPTPSCQSLVSRSIWYRFTPSSNGIYTISTCASSGTASSVDDTVMAIYTSSTGACGGTLTEIPSTGGSDGCDDDETGCVSEQLQSLIITRLTGGTTYFIVVWQFDTPPPTAGNTAIQLRVSAQLPPPNENCASAIALTLNTPVNGSTKAALNDYQLSGSACFTGIDQVSSTAAGGDSVFSFTAPGTNNYSFRVNNYDPASNLVLYVASSCPGGTPPVTVATCLGAANRNIGGRAEEVMCLPLAANQQVFIFVDENAISDGSDFNIEVNICAREVEPNNTPATAIQPVFGIEGTISPAGDADFFSLGTLPNNSRVFALVDGVAAAVDRSSQGDFDLRVTTTTDTLEYDDANNDPKFGIFSANIAGTPTTGVPTFLRISHFTTVGTSEPYRLYAITQPPGANPLPSCPAVTTSATPETEPNDTIGQANTAANKYFSGSLSGPSPSTDVDTFSFTANAGDMIFLSLDGDPCRDNTPINAALSLLDSGGNVLVMVNDGGSTSSTTSGAGSLTSTTPNSPAEALVFRARTTATYYAQVSVGTVLGPGAGDYLLSIFTTPPTAAKFSNEQANNSATATRYDDGVSIRWRTGVEIDNLGFNVYREEAGKQVRVNSQLIAGSAFMIGAGTSLGAGKSYSWFDNSAPQQQATYWIESLDLLGQRSWYGPIATGASVDKTVDRRSAMTLGELGKTSLNEGQTLPIERRANLRTVAESGVSIQSVIAGQSSAKIAVRNEGWYRITQSELAAAGFNINVDPRNLRLFVDGHEQPINVVAKDKFDAQAAIEFYGIGIDSASTDEHIYWLTGGTQRGERIQAISSPAGSGLNPSFLSTVERKDRTVYFPALRNGDKENFFGAVVAGDPVDQVINLQHLDSESTGTATLEVALQGVTLFDHRVEAHINGKTVGELVFKGQEQGVARFSISQSLLKEGANGVRLAPLGGPADISIVYYCRVTYWHTFVADHDQLRFNASGRQAVAVDGFSTAAIRVFDVTNAGAPQEIVGAIKPSKAGYSVRLKVPGSGTRTLIAVTDNSMNRAYKITLDQPSSWRQPNNAASFVIFTRREFMMSLGALVTLRQSQGYTVAVVDVEDAYDEFSFGNKTPQAITDFLAYAQDTWKTPPRFVMLVGDASFDTKNYLGFGDNDLVPTKLVDTELLETASDDALVDFNDDGIADIAIGRLPVRSAREAASVVNKLIGYDRAAPSDEVLLVVDDNRDGPDFEKATADLRTVIPRDHRIEQINRAGLDPTTARSALMEALNRGPQVVNYVGHGNSQEWRGGLLATDDVASMSNGDRLPLFVMMTCLTGYFHDAQFDSLAEALLRTEKGGAVAVWASAGLTVSSDQGVMDMALFKRLFETNSAKTLGEAVMEAKSAALNKDVRSTWILLGDPTLRLNKTNSVGK
jgi:hypothetical protein